MKFSNKLTIWWFLHVILLLSVFVRSGGHFKNTCELLNLRALKFSHVDKIYIYQCMGKIFWVEFQRYPLKFHTKYLTHTLKDIIFIQHRALWFKSSCTFLKCPLGNSTSYSTGVPVITISWHSNLSRVTHLSVHEELGDRNCESQLKAFKVKKKSNRISWKITMNLENIPTILKQWWYIFCIWQKMKHLENMKVLLGWAGHSYLQTYGWHFKYNFRDGWALIPSSPNRAVKMWLQKLSNSTDQS